MPRLAFGGELRGIDRESYCRPPGLRQSRQCNNATQQEHDTLARDSDRWPEMRLLSLGLSFDLSAFRQRFTQLDKIPRPRSRWM